MIEGVIQLQREYALEKHVPIIEDQSLVLLKQLVQERQPKRILEIGTAIGYSGLIMLSLSSGSHLTTMDIDSERLEKAEEYFNLAEVSNRVRIIEDDANYILTLLEGEFDFIFLDGPKAHYKSMLPHILRLLAKGGIIFVDDVYYHGWVKGDDYPMHKHRTIITNMRAFIKEVEENPSLKVTSYDVGQGIMVIEKC